MIGILGSKGRMGGFHAAALKELGVPFIGMDTRDGDVDIEAMAQAVDAAIIATPTPLHIHHIKEFLKEGKPVLVEKPIAMSIEEANEIGFSARHMETSVHVGYLNRFQPAFDIFMNMVRGRTGTLLIQRSNQKPFGEYGGAGIDLATHDIDLLNFGFGRLYPDGDYYGISLRSGTNDTSDRCVYHFSVFPTLQNSSMVDGILDASYRVGDDDKRTRLWRWFGEQDIVLDLTAQSITVDGEMVEVQQVNQVLEQDRVWLKSLENGDQPVLCTLAEANYALRMALTGSN